MQKQTQFDLVSSTVATQRSIIFVVQGNQQQVARWERRNEEIFRNLQSRNIEFRILKNSAGRIWVGINHVLGSVMDDYVVEQHCNVTVFPISHTCTIHKDQCGFFADAIIGRSALVAIYSDQEGYDIVRYLNLAHEIVHTPNLARKESILGTMLDRTLLERLTWLLSDFQRDHNFDPDKKLREIMEATPASSLVRWMNPLLCMTVTQKIRCTRSKRIRRPRGRAKQRISTSCT